MTTLQRLNAKRQVTINRLAIDVLSMILNFIHEDFADSDPEADHPHSLLLFRSPLSLSHVCRQFRSVVLSMPKLWSTISNPQDPCSIPRSIRLSQDRLHISFNPPAETPMHHGQGHSSKGQLGPNDISFLKNVQCPVFVPSLGKLQFAPDDAVPYRRRTESCSSHIRWQL